MESITKLQLDSYLETYKDIISINQQVIFIFLGSNDPNTGKSWCPDCVRAEEPIQNYVIPQAKERNIPIYDIQVGPREQWKDKTHPLRHNKLFKLRGVPTIFYWKAEGTHKVLVEEQIYTGDLLNSLFE